MASSNLDDLLKSIRDEAKKESALVVTEGNREEQLVDEEVDERILNLLGLDDVFDIDYATYKTLLRERMVLLAECQTAKSLQKKQKYLQKNLRRSREKTGRFKVKKKKITAQDIKSSPSIGKSIGGVEPQKTISTSRRRTRRESN